MSNVTTHIHFQAFENEVAELSPRNVGRTPSIGRILREEDWEYATEYSQEDVFSQLSNYGGLSHDYA